MIIAGLDEAGYGPLLGPLVVGCCAFEVESDGDEGLPCIWKRLSKLVSRKRSPSGRKLHVNDSKLVYSSSIGIHELERSVLAFVLAQAEDSPPGDLPAFLSRTADNCLPHIETYPWYRQPEGERFPLDQDALPIRLLANALRGEMRRNGAVCVHLNARVLLERQLNELLHRTRNKASVLFSTAAIHLDYLLRNFGHKPMTIVCDRQGGRAHYGSLLRLMFEDWSLEVLEERQELSDYRLLRGQNAVRIIFREKAEAECLPVALASMLSKYLRESLMRRFNSFWLGHLPGVAPTAGYYVDGERFLRDIDSKRRELRISDEQLIRSR